MSIVASCVGAAVLSAFFMEDPWCTGETNADPQLILTLGAYPDAVCGYPGTHESPFIPRWGVRFVMCASRASPQSHSSSSSTMPLPQLSLDVHVPLQPSRPNVLPSSQASPGSRTLFPHLAVLLTSARFDFRSRCR